MNLKQEICQDIIDNCDIVLDRLKQCELTNNTAEGRMIYQCRWLTEQASAGALSFPVEDYTHTLRHVAAEQLLMHLASSEEKYREEIDIYLYRLLKLIKGKPLLKPAYYPYAIRCIEALIVTLRQASRPLDEYEQGMIDELMQLRNLLSESKIEPPLMNYLPDYSNFNKVYVIFESSIDDLPNGKHLCKTVANLIFEGVRPDTWVSPEAADRETTNL